MGRGVLLSKNQVPGTPGARLKARAVETSCQIPRWRIAAGPTSLFSFAVTVSFAWPVELHTQTGSANPIGGFPALTFDRTPFNPKSYHLLKSQSWMSALTRHPALTTEITGCPSIHRDLSFDLPGPPRRFLHVNHLPDLSCAAAKRQSPSPTQPISAPASTTIPSRRSDPLLGCSAGWRSLA